MKFFAALLVSFVLLQSVVADNSPSTDLSRSWPENFDKGNWEFSSGMGGLFSPFIATRNRPTENYAGPLVQIGYMLNHLDSDADSDAWRGNFEVLSELFGAGVFAGSGN